MWYYFEQLTNLKEYILIYILNYIYKGVCVCVCVCQLSNL